MSYLLVDKNVLPRTVLLSCVPNRKYLLYRVDQYYPIYYRWKKGFMTAIYLPNKCSTEKQRKISKSVSQQLLGN